MRKAILMLLLAVLASLLSGCSGAAQVENLACALVLGIDLTDSGEIGLSVVIPKSSGPQENSAGGDGSDSIVCSASGAQFTEALYRLKWAVPRALDLSQIELIVVSEKMASDARFPAVAESMTGTNGLYSAARLAVCEGSASDLVALLRPTVGAELSAELTAVFEDSTHLGFIPDSTFADYRYQSVSVLSDPLGVRCIVTSGGMSPEQSGGEPQDHSGKMSPEHSSSESPEQSSGESPEHIGGMASEQSGNGDPQATGGETSVIIPEPSSVVSGDDGPAVRFLGAAVFREGRLAGTLTGEELLFCRLLRGEKQSFPMIVGGIPVYLTTIGRPDVAVDTASQPMNISVGLRLAVWSGGEDYDASALTEALEVGLRKTIDVCRSFGAEPFRFADRAVAAFPDLPSWEAFGWRERFSDCTFDFSFSLVPEDD